MTGFLAPLLALLGAFTQSPAAQTPSATDGSLPSVAATLPTRFAVDDERLGVRSPWYFTLGASFVTTRSTEGAGGELDFDDGWGLQLALGHRYFGATDDAMMLDVELEGLYTDQESGGGAIDGLETAALLLNGLAAFHIAEETEVFLGGGVGVGWLDVGVPNPALWSFDDEGPHFAWQLRAGVRFGMGSSTDIEVGYRYLNIAGADLGDGSGSEFELEAQQHSLGLSVRFGA